MLRDQGLLIDIDAAARRIAQFVRDMDHAAFLADERTRYAVYAQIVIIGEASRQVSQEFQQAHPVIPWRQITGMRNRIVHEYWDIDWERVWEVASIDVPQLLLDLNPLLPKEP